MKSKNVLLLSAFLSLLFFKPLYSQDNVSAFQCGEKILPMPRDGKSYSTVRIGKQCWMAENLDIGVRISLLKDQRDNGIIEKYCYDNKDDNCKIYGGLYQWDEVMQYASKAGATGLCPDGWHLPSEDEWCEMAVYLDSTFDCSFYGPSGTDITGKMKSPGTIEDKTGLWYKPDNGTTNESGFSALPAGTRSIYSKFFYKGYHAYFWTSTGYDKDEAWYHYIKYCHTKLYREHYFKPSGYSVRCVRGGR